MKRVEESTKNKYPYAPTPTIIEEAKTLYENHSVEDITRHEADKGSTDTTTVVGWLKPTNELFAVIYIISF